ncbi:xanthine dehydrogenase small subunit [Arthrobacter sp. Sr24]
MSNLEALPDPLADTEPAFTVNGTVRPFGLAPAHTTALDWLRSNGLTGAKEGCAEGECGACAILVLRADTQREARWSAVNSCLVPMASLDGQELLTAEGLGIPDNLHPVQAAMAAAGGSQCGYCTPGFVCAMAAEFYRSDRQPRPDPESATEPACVHPETGPNGFELHALSGNLCRCTGYRPIRDAAYSLPRADDDDSNSRRRRTPAPEFHPTFLERDDGIFTRATTLTQAVTLLAENPTAMLIAGSTDWGVEVTIRARRAPLVIAIESIPELCAIEIGDAEIEIGAAVPFSEIDRVLGQRVPLLRQLIPRFASTLIRNRATIGGNLGTASPIGDSPPALLALDAQIVLLSVSGERVLPLADYFTGYRATVKHPEELIKSVRIPLPSSNVTAFHKIAKRRFDDISSVAIAFSLQIDEGVITKALIGLGGVAATPLRARATEAALEGAPWNQQTVDRAAVILETEGTPMDDHRASSAYRTRMLSQSLLKLYSQNSTSSEASS